MRGAALLLAFVATGAAPCAHANAPESSVVPPARPGPIAAAPPHPAEDPIGALLSRVIPPPPPRPDALTETAHPTVVQKTAATRITQLAVARSLVPMERPENLLRRQVVARSGMAQSGDHARSVTANGSVCGVKEIKGVALQSIPGRIQGCGVESPVKITSVSGIPLSQAATIDCPTAVALNDWVSDSVIPRVGRLGGGVQGLRVFAHYACRTRNNQPGGKVSEHGRGRAIDIGGIVLKNGVELTVLDDWRGQHGKLMQTLHADACGTFGTVLGPKSDRFHQNHFHFDTARYRSGSYCR